MSADPTPADPLPEPKTAWGKWLQDRIPIDIEALRVYSNEPVPLHLKHWWWCLGGTPALLFGVQMVTGILLAFYYVPDPRDAYESIQRIDTVVDYGWFIRSIHRWSPLRHPVRPSASSARHRSRRPPPTGVSGSTATSRSSSPYRWFP